MRRLSLEPYGAVAYMATDARAWKALARKFSFLDENPPQSAGRCVFTTVTPKGGGIPVPTCVLWVDPDMHAGNRGELVDTCAHEASHAAGDLFAHIGHRPKDGDEPMAYLIGCLTRFLYEGLPE
jgi:hypothetical protein